MSKDCKQRFKGVENFLRRVAFNLGNTPSQTEVKIISCIPIDVTDLQQKIALLEKQLESTSHKHTTSVVHTAICNLPCPGRSNVAVAYPNHSSVAVACSKHSDVAVSCQGISCYQSSGSHNQNCSPKPKSIISFKCPTAPSQAQECRYLSTDISEITNTGKGKSMECRKNFFIKRKKIPKKKKLKTQLIYYTQNENRNPFNNYSLADDETSKNRRKEESNTFDRSYLTDMVRKQYKPEPVNEGTNASEFSTPICRDVFLTHKTHGAQPYESDVCSCCHGPFQNIDNHVSKQNQFDIILSRPDIRNAYYDSNLYDVVPVKENPVKVKKVEVPKRKEPKKQPDIECWPGNIRPRYKIPTMIVNYHTIAPMRQHNTRTVTPHNRKDKVMNKMAKLNPILSNHLDPQSNTHASWTRSVEFGEVYPKRLKKTRQMISKLTPKKVTKRNDAACLTTAIANTECQTISVSNANPEEEKKEEAVEAALPEDSTEVTLNQIKNILQSVLAEVKTNSKICNIPEQAKKDAVVQNGPSQSNIYEGSSLLQSYTYSPYNMNPYGGGASCSRQTPTSNFCPNYPNMPPSSVKCMHYPLFVQPARNMCANCYRNNSHVIKLPNIKHAASAATNTEQLGVRSKETENLIKEIYKSMALDVEITKDIPVTEHGDINKSIRMYNTNTEERETKHIAEAISEIFKNTKPIDTSVTQNTDTPLESKLASNETSFRSQPERSYQQSMRKESVDYYSNNVNSETVDNDETEQVSQELESDEDSDDTIINEEEYKSSDTETESDDVVIAIDEPQEKKQKKSIFSKMLKIFKPRSRNRKIDTKGGKEDQASESDSDDYQTVYSHKVPSPKRTHQTIKSKAHSKVFVSKQPQLKPRNQSPVRFPRRSPYMEQEYRRYFDEKLTFHDKNVPRYSSTRGTAPPKRPAYYQKVEARSALVDPCTQARIGYGTRQYYQGSDQKVEESSAAFADPNTQTRVGYGTRKNQERDMRQDSRNQNQNVVRGKSDPPVKVLTMPPKAIGWLKKHKLGIHCGEQWKKLILES